MRTVVFVSLLALPLAGCEPIALGPTGSGTQPAETALTDADEDGFVESRDCNDEDADINPDADEVCDGIDNDCDGEVDTSASDMTTWYADVDGDGYGDDATAADACEAPDDAIDAGGDCADEDETIHPGAPELCDGVDNDCDGGVDVGATDATVNQAPDEDEDGFGNAKKAEVACELTEGYVEDVSDCDDRDAAVHPGAAEVCNTVDDDCDGTADIGAVDTPTWYPDVDLDTYGDPLFGVTQCDAPAGSVAEGTDCDDAQAAINPAAVEVCDAAAVDEDCDTLVNDADDSLDTTTTTTWYDDSDGNGFGTSGTTLATCAQPPSYVATLATAADIVCSAGVWEEDADSATVDGADFTFDGTGTFSVRFRANLDDTVNGTVFVKGDDTTHEWSITVETLETPGSTSLCLNQEGVGVLACETFTTGDFHDYALTYDAGPLQWYEDGVEVGFANLGDIGTGDPATALTVGNYPGDTAPAIGDFDDLAIWSTALSASAVVDLAAGTSVPTDDASVVAWWRFDEGSGAVAADLSGRSNDLALSGVGWVADCP